jgi:thioredoxin 1
MKNKANWILVIICIIGLFGYSTSSTNNKPSAKAGITFHTGTWAEALAKAKKENKLIFLDIYATWCGPCKKLKKNTFTNSKVAAYFNTKFINVTLDGEEGEGAMLASKFNLNSYPTLYFINADGKIVKTEIGYLNPNELLRYGKSVVK